MGEREQVGLTLIFCLGLSAGNKKTDRHQLRCRVSGFTPWTVPVAMILRSVLLQTSKAGQQSQGEYEAAEGSCL